MTTIEPVLELDDLLSAEPSGRSLAELEGVIERGRQTFLEVGRALLEIRDGRLYREHYATWEAYCRERWGWSRRNANYQIQAANVVETLGTTVPKPTTERQARALAAIPVEERTQVWDQAVEAYGEQPTAAQIAKARMGVHYSSETPEWYTPRHVLDAVVAVLGTIDLDPCSETHETPNVPAKRHYTLADDGLTKPWAGKVFMNPPYGRERDGQPGIGAWIAAFIHSFGAGDVTEAIALVPARTDTNWFDILIQNSARMTLLLGRLHFGDATSGAPFPSVLAYLGLNVDRFTQVTGRMGNVIVSVHWSDMETYRAGPRAPEFEQHVSETPHATAITPCDRKLNPHGATAPSW